MSTVIKMKTFIKLLITLIIIIGMLWFGDHYTNNVTINFMSYNIETSVVLFVMVLGFIFILLHYFLLFIGAIAKIPTSFKKNRSENLRNKTVQQLNLACANFFEMDFTKANDYAKNVISSNVSNEEKLIAYLISYKIALQSNDLNAIKNIDYAVHEINPSKNFITHKILYAEHLFDTARYTECLEILSTVSDCSAKHKFVNYLQMKAYTILGNFDEAYKLLKDLVKKNVNSEFNLTDWQLQIIAGIFENAASYDKVSEVYKWLDSSYQQRVSYLESYFNVLIRLREFNRLVNYISQNAIHNENNEGLILTTAQKLIECKISKNDILVLHDILLRLSVDSKDYRASLVAGLIEIELSNYMQAKDNLLKSLELNPNNDSTKLTILKLAHLTNDEELKHYIDKHIYTNGSN